MNDNTRLLLAWRSTYIIFIQCCWDGNYHIVSGACSVCMSGGLMKCVRFPSLSILQVHSLCVCTDWCVKCVLLHLSLTNAVLALLVVLSCLFCPVACAMQWYVETVDPKVLFPLWAHSPERPRPDVIRHPADHYNAHRCADGGVITYRISLFLIFKFSASYFSQYEWQITSTIIKKFYFFKCWGCI